MKIIIAGGRDFIDEVQFKEGIEGAKSLISQATEIVSGGAPGADHLGEQWAGQNGISVRKFPAEWGKYGRGAGPKRNQQMAEYADGLIAFWNGTSRGTKDMIERAVDRGLKVYIHQIKESNNDTG